MSTVGSSTHFWNGRITLSYGISVLSLCLVTSVFCYAKIFFTLRHNQVQAEGNVNQLGKPSQIVSLNRPRYIKTVSSALWVLLAIVVSNLPFLIMEVLFLQRGMSSDMFVAWSYSGTLNPILYCWKIREVREAVKTTIERLFCSSI